MSGLLDIVDRELGDAPLVQAGEQLHAGDHGAQFHAQIERRTLLGDVATAGETARLIVVRRGTVQ